MLVQGRPAAAWGWPIHTAAWQAVASQAAACGVPDGAAARRRRLARAAPALHCPPPAQARRMYCRTVLPQVCERVLLELNPATAYTFPSFHKKLEEPYDYYAFGQRYIRWDTWDTGAGRVLLCF